MTAASVGDVLVAEGLTKHYGGLIANNSVGMRLVKGEVRGLIGPNGAGKTTFVNLITGIEIPDAGSVKLHGREIARLMPHRIADAGLVRSFQMARVFGNLTCVENLMIPWFASGTRDRVAAGTARARDLLRLSSLQALADAPASSLSGGQRMLLQACAGFMIPNVSVYVLDEPFAGINPVLKDILIDLILKENGERQITFLIVSHEMDVIRRMCPRVTVMIAGQVAAEGSLDEVAAREDVITAYLGRSAV